VRPTSNSMVGLQAERLIASNHLRKRWLPPDPKLSSHNRRQLLSRCCAKRALFRSCSCLVGEFRLPSMFTFFEPVEAGGLMAYSFDLVELYKRAANNINAILEGAKPGDIPFYQASKFELSINLKAAKQLGISVPPALVAGADNVID